MPSRRKPQQSTARKALSALTGMLSSSSSSSSKRGRRGSSGGGGKKRAGGMALLAGGLGLAMKNRSKINDMVGRRENRSGTTPPPPAMP
jgi:hypothetical protein